MDMLIYQRSEWILSQASRVNWKQALLLIVLKAYIVFILGSDKYLRLSPTYVPIVEQNMTKIQK